MAVWQFLKQVIIIMTTNVGAESISRSSMGFTEQDHSRDNTEALKRVFTPEFRNRLDAIIQFNALEPSVVTSVVDKFLVELQVQLDDKQVTLEIDDEARDYLADKGYDRRWAHVLCSASFKMRLKTACQYDLVR